MKTIQAALRLDSIPTAADQLNTLPEARYGGVLAPAWHNAGHDEIEHEFDGALTARRTHSGGNLVRFFLMTIVSACLFFLSSGTSYASTAYGSLNNFDCVNDTGVEAHGFVIELDDVHSKDITYTYDYNHYGIPKITEDNTDPLHPKVFVTYASAKNPDGTWAAYTAIPAGPIAPTQGHQFTNPAINFGGEHFGVGYYGAPSSVKYNWLIDDLTAGHNLVNGPAVYVATPTFAYYPPAALQPLPQVQAVIVPPPPPAPPVLQFGEATWVKEIKTTTHNSNKIELVDLVDPDPAHPEFKNWANGEPAEVEVEWKLLQTEFANAGNPKGELKGLPEDLPGGDEIITRRYEFYKYVGPIDAESGEAMGDTVAGDGIHGVGSVTFINSFDALGEPVVVTVDLTSVVVVGDFFGAQMAGFDLAPALGLIDHIPGGDVGVAYAERSIVIGGGAGFLATTSGSLPNGTTLDGVTGIFSGTPTTAGVFTFSVDASDTSGAHVTKEYTVTVAGDVVPPLTYSISTSASPAVGGATSGGGNFNSGTNVTVLASPNPGYSFVNWTESGAVVSGSASYSFAAGANRTLVANFVPTTCTISTSAFPLAGGTTSGSGIFQSGVNVTVLASPNPGYSFVNWTEGGAAVSGSASYSFTAGANRTLVANFVPITYAVVTSASPVAGGITTVYGTFNIGANV
ncbi:MAG: putative Ig domain-containing protein, partial [Verrucomicrobia bacterium]|nr:putative Ig domain-containing protein [Verrucomicrobiota bacterium]